MTMPQPRSCADDAREEAERLRRELASANLLLALHRRYHGKVGCPGLPECYVCEGEAGVTNEREGDL